jgi:UrcA family protein
MIKFEKLSAAGLAFCAATLSLGFATPAPAAETVRSARIVYADLDLATPKGKRVLALRIARAADTLCGDLNERLDIRVRKAANACRAEVARDARQSINGTVRVASR